MKLDRRRLGRRRWSQLHIGDWVWILDETSMIGQIMAIRYDWYTVDIRFKDYAAPFTFDRIKLAKASDEEVTAWLLQEG